MSRFTWNVDIEDLQATFDKVAAHLHAAPGRSMIDSSCAYRGTNGGKCAVGAILDGDFHGTNTSSLELMLINSPENFDQVPSNQSFSLLTNLQQVHDFKSNWEEYDSSWGTKGFIGHNDLAIVAKYFNLNYTHPTEGTPS